VPLDAVTGAVSIQKTSPALPLCISIRDGEVVVQRNDLFGDGVIIAGGSVAKL
jgi:hypothetical protein